MLTVFVHDAGMKSGLYKPLIGRVVFVPGSEFGVDVPELYYKGVIPVLFLAPVMDSLARHDNCCDIFMLHSTATCYVEIRFRHERSCLADVIFIAEGLLRSTSDEEGPVACTGSGAAFYRGWRPNVAACRQGCVMD